MSMYGAFSIKSSNLRIGSHGALSSRERRRMVGRKKKSDRNKRNPDKYKGVLTSADKHDPRAVKFHF